MAVENETIDYICDGKNFYRFAGDAKVEEDDSSSSFSIIDPNGNAIVQFSRGHIKTKKFDSSKVGAGGSAGLPSQNEIEYISKIIHNPHVDLRKQELKILDIGNSFTSVALGTCGTGDKYLSEMINAAGIDKNSFAYCSLIRGGASFSDWYNVYHDADSKGYAFKKNLGTLPINTPDGSSSSSALFKDVLANDDWDVILVHQKSVYSNDFSLWVGDGKGGKMRDFIKILKTTNPQACIGTYIVHSAPTNNIDTDARWAEIADSTKRFAAMYDIDLIIPYGTAVQNARLSAANPNNSTFCGDGTHVDKGLGQYVAAGATYESIFAPRYGVSILGNTFRTSEAASDYVIPVDENNVGIAQMCVIEAVNDFYTVKNIASDSL
jgi:hypothetical protein